MLARRTFLKATLAVAALGMSGWASRTSAASDAGRFIQELADTAIATAAARNISEAERVDRFRRLFVSAFDLPEISRFVLGRYWRGATPDQQQRFLELFKEITVLTWSRRFQDYGGETLDVINVAPDGEQGVFVESRINRAAGGQPIPVTWRLRRRDGGFQIVDIIVEGVSMAITHRSEYTSAARSSGGDLDSLLNAMANKINVLRG